MSDQGKFELFRDRKRQWRWRLLATNGKIIATSGEGYTRRGAAVHGISRVRALAPASYEIAEKSR